MMTEYRLEVLQEYSRAKRAYTKRDSAYWHEGPSKLNVEKQYKGQQSLKEHVSYSLQVVEDHDDLYKRIPADVVRTR
eukprot:Em0008g813a